MEEDQNNEDSSCSAHSNDNKSTNGATNENNVTFLVTNARSLAPKENSLATNIQELDAAFAIVSESWLKEGNRLDHHLVDLECGEDLKIIHKSRKSKRGKTAGGGIAVVFGVYIPPSTRAKNSDRALELLSEAIAQAKSDFTDPMIFIGGDFNRRDLNKATDPYPDINLYDVPATRLGAKLNLAASNMSAKSTFKLPPLTTFDGQKKSDHEIIAVETNIPNEDRFIWRTYTTRPRSKTADKAFMEAIKKIKWTELLANKTVNQKVESFNMTLSDLMNKFFPLKYHKVRSTDNPWISQAIRRKIRARKKIFRKHGRNKKWKRMKARTDQAIRRKKEDYYKKFKEKALLSSDPSLYYKAIRGLKDRNKLQEFDVMNLRPFSTKTEVGEELADFFSNISSHFKPLDRTKLPPTC